MEKSYKLTLLGPQIEEPCPKSKGEPYFQIEMDDGIEKQTGIFTKSNTPEEIYTIIFWTDVLNFQGIYPILLPITMEGIEVNLN